MISLGQSKRSGAWYQQLHLGGTLGRSVMLGLLMTACKDLAGPPALPPGTQDPKYYNTPTGAALQARAATDMLRSAIAQYAIVSGVLTDELAAEHVIYAEGKVFGADLDVRSLPAGSGFSVGLYNQLQRLRGQLRVSIGGLGRYAPTLPSAVRGRLYAYLGYAEIMLADIFCSGVPLSTLDFGKDFTYAPGSSTTDVYRHASALFDTALALSSDSTEVQILARVGHGRAELALGNYAEAARSVTGISRVDQALIRVDLYRGNNLGTSSWEGGGISVADGEGPQELFFRTSTDPRVGADSVGATFAGNPVYFPRKYTPDSTMLALANGYEAHLILAEAALHGIGGNGESAMQMLNTLRDEAYPGVFTLIPGGLTAAQQEDTLFAERAKWLFLTGHRQGDVRRRLRQSGVLNYPTGLYFDGRFYGTDVNFPIPDEELLNPLFHGCINRGA